MKKQIMDSFKHLSDANKVYNEEATEWQPPIYPFDPIGPSNFTFR